MAAPQHEFGFTTPDAATVTGRDVWLVHPWSLGPLPSALPPDTIVIAVVLADFHSNWPWDERRWRFVGSRMAELASRRWYGSDESISQALAGARSVRSIAEPHLAPWLARWANCWASPTLFPPVDRQCHSFSNWWSRTTRDIDSVNELLAVNLAPAS